MESSVRPEEEEPLRQTLSTKSVGFADSAEESVGTTKEPDTPALASEYKAEDYKYDPDEKGETWDIYKQRATVENVSKRKSEDAVLIKAKADAAIRAAQVASACAEASQGFLDQASVGRKTRGRTAIVAIDAVEIPEERRQIAFADEDEEEQSGSEGTDPGETYRTPSVHKSIKVFQQHDEDGNGELDKEEFVNLLPHLGIKNISRDEAEDLFTDIDTDGSGNLDVTEFGLWFTKFKAAEKAFKITDTDGGGTIDLDEFKVLVQRLGIAEGDFWIETESNKLFKEIDTDSSGSIDMKEFVMWYSTSPLTDASPLEKKLRKQTMEGFDEDEDVDKENEGDDEAQAAYRRKTAAIKAAEKAAADTHGAIVEKAAAGNAATERAAVAEKAIAEKAALEAAELEKASVEKAAAEKAAAEKTAGEQAAAEAAAAPAAAAAAAAPAEAPPDNASRSGSQAGPFYSVEELQNGVPPGVDPTRKEDYLADADFEVLLKMARDAFEKLPAWKKQAAKKGAKIF